jgi:hypothetical protein
MSGDGAGFHGVRTAAVDATVENTASAARHDWVVVVTPIAPAATFERGLD